MGQENNEIDFSRYPTGETDWLQLIRRLEENGDLEERYYLEIKGSETDLASKRVKHKIAKFILGAANRDPEIAKQRFQGYALMVIGVDDHAAPGVDKIEKMELDKGITPFLGAAGPHWDIQRVPVANNPNKEVLVIVVNPPENGQHLFACRAEGEGLKNGGIYIRADGCTREATADEIDELLKRGQQQMAHVKLNVYARGQVNQVHIDRRRTIEEYLAKVEEDLITGMPKPADKLRPLQMNIIDNLTSHLENRTREEYRQEIAQWKERCIKDWNDACRYVYGLLNPCNLIVKNTTKINLTQVRLRIHFEDKVELVDHQDVEDVPEEVGLPKIPSKWGMGNKLNYPDFSSYSLAANRSVWIDSVDSNEGVDFNVEVGDLRPEETVDTSKLNAESQVLIVLSDFAHRELKCTWSATAGNINDRFVGQFTIPVAPVSDLTEVMRYLLRIDKAHD